MPIFLSSYDTTIGHRYTTNAIETALVKATVSNNLTKNENGLTVLEDTSNIPVDIPSFVHPIFVDKHPAEGLFVDARPFVSTNRQTGETRINSQADYNLLLGRAGLEQIWRNEPPTVLRNMSPVPAAVFSSWIAENLRQRFGIGPEDQYKLQIFSAWFYYSLFTNESKPDDQDYNRTVKAISTATKIAVEPIMEVLDGQDYVDGVEDFCKRLYEVTNAIQLKDFSSILLYPILQSTWWSSNSQELISVSIEHVPTFMALLVSAATERAYKRSKLSIMMERIPVSHLVKDYVLQTTAMLRS